MNEGQLADVDELHLRADGKRKREVRRKGARAAGKCLNESPVKFHESRL